ncbi:LOW QUALITY PROTEIN: uncharacterized oxidoreductase YjmC-like [Pollicipes pollicipes]|uniref:LOW QUALITY PROTEIN: uncharacterized oxidoreductase YjmC-like n=1 Tax=Pollicipes pollicipes TaxID=41117 RepID=UPI00188539FC|nr:LOW QUALITY PROTEIN: uncharacterized oxidoreductase YjmC-like [Pollicipes pollicipes]
MASKVRGTTIPLTEVRRFIMDVMEKAGASGRHAGALADLLVTADQRGHFSHGLNRLEYYLTDIRGAICDPAAEPVVTRQTAATALVDGRNGLGPVIGNFCTDLAIQKARESGIGWVVAHNSNHYGIAGWYALRCAEAGLVGMSFTNTSPLVVPTRARQPMLGTNPIACAAPGEGGDSFCLDMATCTVAVGKIEVQRRKREPIPEGWATNAEGRITTDADAAVGLLPLGGDEAHSGYKGYGLAFMVELFCGLLGGAAYGPHVRRWDNQRTPADLGQCFVALDPAAFAPGFSGRLQELMTQCRETERANPDRPVLVPGDPERAHMARVARDGGVTYHENQLASSDQLAAELGVQPMQAV